MTEEIKHINEKNQEYIAEGNRMTKEKDSICCSWYESCTYYMQCEHLYNENKDLSEDVYRLEQENKALQAYKDINEDFKKAWDELNEKYKQLRSTLEEINLILDELKQQYDYMTDYSEIKEIQDKINECLGE